MAAILDFFEKIWVINLATRADRLNEMRGELHRVGLGFNSSQLTRFDAVRPLDAGGFPSLGARGCFLSHLGILRAASAQELQSILILEDDLNFAVDFGSRANDVLKSATDQDCSVFYGGYVLPDGGCPVGHGAVSIDHKVPVQTTHFIGLRGPAIKAAADYLEAMLLRPAGDPLGGPMHVDGAYNWFRRANPQFKTVLAVPELGYQRASMTDIHELRWFDRWLGVRRVVAAVRKRRNA